MTGRREMEVVADWVGLVAATRVGDLTASKARGKEVFAFEYDDSWLHKNQHALDPALHLYPGPQYPQSDREQLGVFLDSAPDRWGRLLMRRREALLARQEDREERPLLESDYLLGVHDAHRMGALRYRMHGRYHDDNDELASPPWTSLRELQHASQQLERDDASNDPEYAHWLRMLIAPGGSLGGARPKASVRDEHGHLWIAKFPSRNDQDDVGGWEMVVNDLLQSAGIDAPQARIEVFGTKQSNPNGHRTFLSRRFDRTEQQRRIHFTSAMTALGCTDGTSGDDGQSYLDLAEVLMQFGAHASSDLEQLWRRIVFFICVSNTDDHLRNHGFLLGADGYQLAPAYDVNPCAHGDGLTLNISDSNNAQNLDLAFDVAELFRLTKARAKDIVAEVVGAVCKWRSVAERRSLGRSQQDAMSRAFRVAMSFSKT